MKSIKTILYDYFTLEFDQELEKEFLNQYYKNSIVPVRFGMILAIVLYALFGILDEYMMPITKLTIWIIRFAVVVPSL